MKRISYNRYIDGKLPPGTKLVTRPSKFGNQFLVAEHGREKAKENQGTRTDILQYRFYQ